MIIFIFSYLRIPIIIFIVFTSTAFIRCIWLWVIIVIRSSVLRQLLSVSWGANLYWIWVLGAMIYRIRALIMLIGANTSPFSLLIGQVIEPFIEVSSLPVLLIGWQLISGTISHILSIGVIENPKRSFSACFWGFEGVGSPSRIVHGWILGMAFLSLASKLSQWGDIWVRQSGSFIIFLTKIHHHIIKISATFASWWSSIRKAQISLIWEIELG